MRKVVVNQYGNEIDYDAAVQFMEDDLREELHRKLAPCTDQEFFDAYANRYFETHKTEWYPNTFNPQM